jgi:cellulose biosynthesis protein BcsQ
MNAVAIYNMKGGVGKSTTAVNLSYIAASSGRRVLLWDLDPQAASSFAFRVRPRVAGFGRKSLKTGKALQAAIKETDYSNLDVLPADFAYRKLDRLLSDVADAGKPARVVEALLNSLGRDYDLVILDCPAGFSLLIEGLFASADAVLVPTIPSVLSLRMVARLVKWAHRSDSPADLSAFFNMVDRRKALHRLAREWSATHSQIFLTNQVPYASVVEQMAVRRMPLSLFAPRDAATRAFEGIWTGLQARLASRAGVSAEQLCWASRLETIESLIVQAESAERPGTDALVNGGWANLAQPWSRA